MRKEAAKQLSMTKKNNSFIIRRREMKHLLTLDMNNYADCTKLFKVTHARALILVNGAYAMQRSSRGDYKLPGGRLEKGETSIEALKREVLEETGLFVIEETIEEIGEIIEIRKDMFDPTVKYICHSLYYKCEVEDTVGETKLSENERQKGLELCFANLEEIIKTNRSLNLEESRIRDTIFLEMVADR